MLFSRDLQTFFWYNYPCEATPLESRMGIFFNNGGNMGPFKHQVVPLNGDIKLKQG